MKSNIFAPFFVFLFLILSACGESGSNDPTQAEKAVSGVGAGAFEQLLKKQPEQVAGIPSFPVQAVFMGTEFDIKDVTVDEFKDQPGQYQGLARKLRFNTESDFPAFEIVLFDGELENKSYQFDYIKLPAKVGLLDRPHISYYPEKGTLVDRVAYTLKLEFAGWVGDKITGSIYFRSKKGLKFIAPLKSEIVESEEYLTVFAGKFEASKLGSQ